VKHLALALALLALWGLGVRAADTIVVVLQVEDAEIITSDLKRLRLAEPAEVRFAVTTPYIAQVFGNDLTVPRNLMRLTVLEEGLLAAIAYSRLWYTKRWSAVAL
jgi:hypothetical protein